MAGMKRQIDLDFNRAPPYVRGSDTSEAAALSIEPLAGSLRAIVLSTLRVGGAMTCDEIEVELAMRHQTASARIRELALAGHIYDDGQRRKTRSGRFAVVWHPKKWIP